MQAEFEPPPQRAVNAPAVVLWLIAAFVGVHLVQDFLPDRQSVWVLLTFAFIPARYGGNPLISPDTFPGGMAGDLWTFVTHMFLHGDWAHLLVNSFWMLAFGSVVARRLGAARFLVLSALAGAAGAALHLMLYWGEMVPVIGASAGISGQMAGAVRFIFADPNGLFAAARADPRKVRALSLSQTFANPRALIFLLVWLGINLLIGLGGTGLAGEGQKIAWEAHIGGFAAGLILFGLLDPWRGARSGWGNGPSLRA